MLRLTDSLRSIITESPFLAFGLQNRLLNLTQTAKYLRPLVEARTKKSIQQSAVLMALSRLQRSFDRSLPRRENFHIEHLAAQANLMTCTYAKEKGISDAVQQLYAAVRARSGYISISESTAQMTVILDASCADLVKEHLHRKPQFQHDRITALSMRFSEKYIPEPGFIAVVLQQLMLQGVNIVEIGSTYTELIVYIEDDKAKLAFETLYGLFGS